MIEHGRSYGDAMPSKSGGPGNARIEELERQVAGLVNALGAFAIGPLAVRSTGPEMIGFAASPSPSAPLVGTGRHDMTVHHTSEERARFVRERIRQRRARAHVFPADFFSDPVWDMLLDLYAAHHERVLVSVSSLCIAASVPATTALRWIKELTARGWFLRTRDDSDGRRIYVHLSEEALAHLDAYFDGLPAEGM